ncbi:MAG: alpha/beta fold hydrolase [Leptolyngbyaceae cyanobacterium SL_1_1]|nr:alpha/beta fold hydrolase [Leptolyngbyaceae cyanobacterium RM1_1_2]NJO08671.1 alpha/beta fold hydrolase [Leptolyngbyaceae cyanobacterium SL_1_1]
MTAQAVNSAVIEKLSWQWRGYNVKYTVQGEGLPLILIHGFGASMGHWKKNIPVLAIAGYRVYALDLLGFGASDKPAIDYTLDLWLALLKDFWHAHVQQPAVFVGNSIGGLLTLMMLANHPETARGGVLINCAGGLNHRPEELILPLRMVMGTFTRLVSSQMIGPFVFNRVRQKHRIRGSLRQVYRNQAAITDELIEMLYQPACDPGAQQVFASVMTAPAGPKPEELLPQIQQPLLVIWGENDPWTPIKGADIYRRLSQRIDIQPKVTFRSIPETGHCPHDERPEVVNPAILSWLTTLTSA